MDYRSIQEELFGTDEQRLERCTNFQNIILDHWKIIPKPMKNAINSVWGWEDRAIFKRSHSRK